VSGTVWSKQKKLNRTTRTKTTTALRLTVPEKPIEAKEEGVSKTVAITTGAVVQRTSVAVAKDEVPGHPTPFRKKINIFPARTTRENRIILNAVQLNTTFRTATV